MKKAVLISVLVCGTLFTHKLFANDDDRGEPAWGSYVEQGSNAKFIYKKMEKAKFALDGNEDGTEFYGKVKCEHSTLKPKQYQCQFIEIDAGEWNSGH